METCQRNQFMDMKLVHDINLNSAWWFFRMYVICKAVTDGEQTSRIDTCEAGE